MGLDGVKGVRCCEWTIERWDGNEEGFKDLNVKDVNCSFSLKQRPGTTFLPLLHRLHQQPRRLSQLSHL
jgi:hypothetical protein